MVVFDKKNRVLLCLKPPSPATGSKARWALLNSETASGHDASASEEHVRRVTGHRASRRLTSSRLCILVDQGQEAPFDSSAVQAIAWALPRVALLMLDMEPDEPTGKQDIAALKEACADWSFVMSGEVESLREDTRPRHAPPRAQAEEPLLASLRAEANAGNKESMFRLGLLLGASASLLRDEGYAEAAMWFRRLADEGNAQAMYHLAVVLETGDNPYQDRAQAMEWYQRAADRSIPDACFNLGKACFAGDGTAQDYAKAMRLFHQAAELGDADSMYILGRMFRDGLGTPPDSRQALEWFRKGAQRGDGPCAFHGGFLLEKGRGIPPDTAAARDLYAQGAALNEARCMGRLGEMMVRATSSPQEATAGIHSLRQAIAQTDAHASCVLADLLRTGTHVEQNIEEAKTLYRDAAASGYPAAWKALDELGASLIASAAPHARPA